MRINFRRKLADCGLKKTAPVKSASKTEDQGAQGACHLFKLDQTRFGFLIQESRRRRGFSQKVSFGFKSGSQWGFRGLTWESFKGLRLKLSGHCHSPQFSATKTNTGSPNIFGFKSGFKWGVLGMWLKPKF